ncbi:MAG: SMEK domain-containing protein [Aeromonas veronii]
MKIMREECLKAISESFSRLSGIVTLQNKIGLTDINKSAEKLFIYILNKTYYLNLSDMNDIQDNYPAIDLADLRARICFQVTSESTNAKFRDTVTKFKKNNLSESFDHLIFLIISVDKKCLLSDSDLSTEVINLSDVYKRISILRDETLSEIHQYLVDNLHSRVDTSNSILKPSIMPTYIMAKPVALLDYLGLSGEQDIDLAEQLIRDVKNFQKTISELTKNQREYLFYIMEKGRFHKGYNGREDRSKVFIVAKQVDQEFGRQGYDIFQVLEGQELLSIEHEYEISGDGRTTTIISPYYSGELDDLNLFAAIKDYCDKKQGSLREIFVDCNFSCLCRISGTPEDTQ